MSEAQLLRPHIEDRRRLLDALHVTIAHLIVDTPSIEEAAARNAALRDVCNILRDEIGLPAVNLHGDEMQLTTAAVDA
jgi:hypothetical protein